MPKSEDFQSFKISDTQQKPLPRSNKPKPQSGEEPVSAGFPTIEGRLEGETLDLSGLQERLTLLNSMADEGSAKEKGAVRKAIGAYERAADLMEFLWETKGGLGEGQEG